MGNFCMGDVGGYGIADYLPRVPFLPKGPVGPAGKKGTRGRQLRDSISAQVTPCRNCIYFLWFPFFNFEPVSQKFICRPVRKIISQKKKMLKKVHDARFEPVSITQQSDVLPLLYHSQLFTTTKFSLIYLLFRN